MKLSLQDSDPGKPDTGASPEDFGRIIVLVAVHKDLSLKSFNSVSCSDSSLI